jgi:hypothetical protein
MNLSEKELEHLIMSKFENKEDRIGLAKRGLATRVTNGNNTGIWAQSQVNLFSYGIADIFVSSFDGNYNLNIDIFELKINSLKMKDVSQVLRYKTGIENLLEYLVDKGDLEESVYLNRSIDCHLIGDGLDDEITWFINEQERLDAFMTSIFTYEFDAFNGLVFRDHSFITYSTAESGFDKYNDESPINSIICDCQELEYMRKNKIGIYATKDGEK